MATHSSYSCLENPMDRGAWQVAKSRTRLNTHTHHSKQLLLGLTLYRLGNGGSERQNHLPQITQQKLFIKRAPHGETRIHMSQSKGSIYERPRGHHPPHPCNMFHRGKCHSVSEMGSVGS